MPKNRHSNIVSFDDFYRAFYFDRWDSLKAALINDKRYVAILNPFANSDILQSFIETNKLQTHPIFKDCVFLDSAIDIPTCEITQLKLFYPLDLASLYPAHLLINLSKKLHPESTIGDLCSAPGGKALYYLFHTQSSPTCSFHFFANEFSNARRTRLKNNFTHYLPPFLNQALKVTPFDAKNWCTKEKEIFDLILLDAPCSSERHYLQNLKMMEEWAPSRSKRLSQEQFSLLCSALILLKPGGHLIYSTCSISPLENDMIIEKLVAKRSNEIEIVGIDILDSSMERSKWGATILPDSSQFGPIYFSHIIKR